MIPWILSGKFIGYCEAYYWCCQRETILFRQDQKICILKRIQSTFRYDKFLCISWAKYFYKHKTLSPRKYRIVVINLKACCSFVNENRYSRRNLFGTNNWQPFSLVISCVKYYRFSWKNTLKICKRRKHKNTCTINSCSVPTMFHNFSNIFLKQTKIYILIGACELPVHWQHVE